MCHAHGVCASDATGLACGASDVTGLACAMPMASVRQMLQVWHVVHQMSQVWHVPCPWRLCVRCHRFGMCHGVCASDVMASVRQMSCHVMLKLPLTLGVVQIQINTYYISNKRPVDVYNVQCFHSKHIVLGTEFFFFFFFLHLYSLLLHTCMFAFVFYSQHFIVTCFVITIAEYYCFNIQ